MARLMRTQRRDPSPRQQQHVPDWEDWLRDTLLGGVVKGGLGLGFNTLGQHIGNVMEERTPKYQADLAATKASTAASEAQKRAFDFDFDEKKRLAPLREQQELSNVNERNYMNALTQASQRAQAKSRPVSVPYKTAAMAPAGSHPLRMVPIAKTRKGRGWSEDPTVTVDMPDMMWPEVTGPPRRQPEVVEGFGGEATATPATPTPLPTGRGGYKLGVDPMLQYQRGAQGDLAGAKKDEIEYIIEEASGDDRLHHRGTKEFRRRPGSGRTTIRKPESMSKGEWQQFRFLMDKRNQALLSAYEPGGNLETQRAKRQIAAGYDSVIKDMGFGHLIPTTTAATVPAGPGPAKPPASSRHDLNVKKDDRKANEPRVVGETKRSDTVVTPQGGTRTSTSSTKKYEKPEQGAGAQGEQKRDPVEQEKALLAKNISEVEKELKRPGIDPARKRRLQSDLDEFLRRWDGL